MITYSFETRNAVYRVRDGYRTVVGEYTWGNVDLTQCSPNGHYPDLSARAGYMHSFGMTENYIILPTAAWLLDYCSIFRTYAVYYTPFHHLQGCIHTKGLFIPDASASKWRRKTQRAGFGTRVSQSVHSDRPRRIKILYNRDAVDLALASPIWIGIRGNPKDVDFFVMQGESRRAVSSTTLRLSSRITKKWSSFGFPLMPNATRLKAISHILHNPLWKIQVWNIAFSRVAIVGMHPY